MKAADRLGTAGVIAVALASAALAVAWGWLKFQRLTAERPIKVGAATLAWTPPAGTVMSEPGEPDEPPLPRNRAATELHNPVGATADSIERGREMYLTYCAVCHGMEGRGDGPLAEKSKVRPTNLTTVLGRLTDGYVYATIRNGGAIMPPLGSRMTPAERWDVVNYLRSISAAPPPGPPAPSVLPWEEEPPASASPPAGELRAASGGLAGDASRGKAVFDATCSLCHDPTSDVAGIGPGLKGLFQWPAHQLSDGTHHASHTEELIRSQIVEGGGGMAAVGGALSEEELADLLAYLKTL